MSLVADPVLDDAPRPIADRWMRRVLRVQDAPPASASEARNAFRTSVVVAGIRCLLTYIILPFVLPFVGLAAGVAPIIGAAIGLIAITCIVSSMRRFWRADHRARWGYTAFGAIMGAFLIALVIRDLAAIG